MFAGKAPFQEFTSLLNPHSRRIVAGIALSAIGRGMTLSLLMVYLHDIRGFSISFGGAVMAWGALFGIICTAPLGSLVDRIGPKKVMLAGLVISGFSALA
ncbi:MAG: MFS transporter, partial [Actinobacteria bacterium]|nr:MFS transporter [Actinomycetota bacterium]